MILAFAGRRAQSMDGDLDALALRVRRLLTALSPSAVVGAMSDGSDLLVLEAALGMDPPPCIHVVLPTPVEVFRVDSVTEGWRDRFERMLGELRGSDQHEVESLALDDGEAAYRAANVAFLDGASRLAGPEERVVALVIAGEGEGAVVQDLVDLAVLRHVPVLRIDTRVDVAERPRVFVAMPFGTKTDPQRKIEVDCNLVYQKILLPALENAQLNYLRADETIDSGVVLQPMIEWLAESDLVIGDLETGNFNVGWEIGLRHLLRPAHTLLIGPEGTIPPFDLNMVRHVTYRQDERGVSDAAAIEAWERLAPYLARVGQPVGGSDSPVDAVMEVRAWSIVKRRAVRDERWGALRRQLALARDLADGDLMLEIVAQGDQLGGQEASMLRAEAGVGLVKLARYREAQDLLADAVAADPAVLRPDAHVNYAQALYQPQDADIAALDAAEQTLKRVLVKRPEQPEVRALLGAIAKRRTRLRATPEEREPDLRLALSSYLHDYERNLSAYYEGVNVLAVATALSLRYADEAAGERAREMLPAVRLAATLARRANPQDFWAAATVAECELHASLLQLDGTPFTEAYRAAGALRPPRGDLNSTTSQLAFLRILGLPAEPLEQAVQALYAGAGVMK